MKTLIHKYNGKASLNSFFPYSYYIQNKSVSINNESEDTHIENINKKSIDELEDIVSPIFIEAITTTPVIGDVISKIEEDVVETPITSPETSEKDIHISSGSLNVVQQGEKKAPQKKVVKANTCNKKAVTSKHKTHTCVAQKRKPKPKAPKQYLFI